MSMGSADFGVERAFELDFLKDDYLMTHQITFNEVTFTAHLASVVANVPTHQIHVILC